jgi:gluconokinase
VNAQPKPLSIVIMGVSGSGKSTVGKLLSQLLRCEFIDADDLHPESNKKAMAAGIALTDVERLPWLKIVGEELKSHSENSQPLIVACSALRRSYRELLTSFSPSLFFIFLDGTKEEIGARISVRSHEFMPSSLLESQFANLEPLVKDENGFRISIDASVETICATIVQVINARNES